MKASQKLYEAHSCTTLLPHVVIAVIDFKTNYVPVFLHVCMHTQCFMHIVAMLTSASDDFKLEYERS